MPANQRHGPYSTSITATHTRYTPGRLRPASGGGTGASGPGLANDRERLRTTANDSAPVARAAHPAAPPARIAHLDRQRPCILPGRIGTMHADVPHGP